MNLDDDGDENEESKRNRDKQDVKAGFKVISETQEIVQPSGLVSFGEVNTGTQSKMGTMYELRDTATGAGGDGLRETDVTFGGMENSVLSDTKELETFLFLIMGKSGSGKS